MDVIVQGQPSIEIGFERKVVDSYKDVDSALSDTSQNPVTNAAITAEIRRQDTAIEAMSEANETFKGEVSGSMDAFKEEVNAEIADKADKSGYFPALTSGFSDHLAGHGESVPAEFSFRASGGKSILDGAARVKELRGNGMVWNQQLRPLSPTEWYINPSYVSLEYSYNYCKLTIAQEASALPANGVAITATTTNQKPALPNHAYLITAEIKVSVAISVGIRNYTSPWGGDYKKNAQAKQWTRVAFIDRTTELYNGYVIVGTTTNIELSVGDTIEIRNVAVVDLTLMFGVGNEPTTVEEFYARKPIGVDEYAYNEGVLIPFNADAIKSVGDNAWDEEFESGTYNSITGKKENNQSMLRSKHLIKVLPNTEYYITVPQEVYGHDAVRQRFYTADGSYLGYEGQATNAGTFKTPLNCGYIGLVIVSPTYNYDISIVLKHSGWKAEVDGGYKPYWDFVREIDPRIKEAFPNGMKPWDKVYNKNGKGVIVKGSRAVDMGTLNWGTITLSDGNVLIRSTDLNDRAYSAGTVAAKCSKYITVNQSKRTDKTISGAGSNTVDVIDSAYTDAASFKAAMAGVMLWYELAEPEIIEYDEPFNLDYEVADFGTEEIISEQPSAPISANIAYGFNAVDQIRNNADEIAQLKATIAQLQAALANMVNNNVEE